MWPRNYALNHPVVPLIFNYAQHWCPVDCFEDWTLEQIIFMLKLYPHVSAKLSEATQQLREKTLEKCKNYYARVIIFGDIRHKLPTKFKISPVAMIPHKIKAYRCILRLSFQMSL